MNIKKIRLLHLINSLDIGGAEKSTIEYSNKLVDRLESINIFSEGGEYLEKGLVSPKIKTYPNFDPHKFKFFKNMTSIYAIVKNSRINLIIYHHRKFLTYIIWIKFFFREVNVVYVAQNYFGDFLNKFLVADAYVALTKKVSNDLVTAGKKKIFIIPHRIEVCDEMYVNGQLNLGYVGRFEPSKGINVLLAAFLLIAQKYPEVKLIFRGKGSQENIIKLFAQKYKLENRIFVETAKINIQEIYKDIGILVLPSLRFEGQGIVLIEAMNLGIPVIGSRVGGITDVIKNNQNGLLFKNGDVKDLAEKIVFIIENPAQRFSLITNAKNEIKKNYDIKSTINEYCALFNVLK